MAPCFSIIVTEEHAGPATDLKKSVRFQGKKSLVGCQSISVTSIQGDTLTCVREINTYIYMSLTLEVFVPLKSSCVCVCKNTRVPLHTCGGRMTASGDSPDCWPCLRRQGLFTAYARLACPTNFWRLSCLHFPLATVSAGIWTRVLTLAQQDSSPLSHLFSSGFFVFFFVWFCLSFEAWSHMGRKWPLIYYVAKYSLEFFFLFCVHWCSACMSVWKCQIPWTKVAVVSGRVGAGNWTLVLWESCQCSSPLSHLQPRILSFLNK